MIIKYIIIKINKYFLKKRLDIILSSFLTQYSRSYIKKLIINNRVKSNSKLLNKPNKKIFNKILIKIKFIKKKKKIKSQKIKINILYEDKYLIIINKPNNFIIHPGYKNFKNTLINALLYYNNLLILIKRLGIVHRLDKDTSGLIIITKTLLTRKLIINAFKYHKIKKEYDGIVIGNIINNGYIKAKISRNIKNRIKMNININGKNAITYYKIIKNFKEYTRVKFFLKSGRTHQIRIHMLYINYPIIGDKKYNKIKKKNIIFKKNIFLYKFNRQALHSCFLNFYHPIYGFNINCYSKIPLDILNLINKLK
ncbi:MAG: RluA family pseudouridine synthase [Enterobacteriaceae bacterium PSpicST2]|nr:MAG: RluA family pseudouridine synthase [Enterobacteriaceae bacterium PSpicST2]WMC19012.1 MAG: RluA family pseudouridine synthase [Enterobacteriaceae bacterium PSpicST1]